MSADSILDLALGIKNDRSAITGVDRRKCTSFAILPRRMLVLLHVVQ